MGIRFQLRHRTRRSGDPQILLRQMGAGLGRRILPAKDPVAGIQSGYRCYERNLKKRLPVETTSKITAPHSHTLYDNFPAYMRLRHSTGARSAFSSQNTRPRYQAKM